MTDETTTLTPAEVDQAGLVGDAIRPLLAKAAEDIFQGCDRRKLRTSSFSQRAMMAGVMAECLMLAAHMAVAQTRASFLAQAGQAFDGVQNMMDAKGGARTAMQ